MTSADEIDALYGLPLDEFTKARNDLARRLRTEGRRNEADEVASRRKPSLPAWVVNQLGRGQPDKVRTLVAAAESIRSGDDDADERFRAAVDALVRAARELLAEVGRRASDSVLQEVATTLRASAAVAPEELTTGRLTEAREASGFDALGGVPVAPRAKGKRTSATTESKPKVDRAAVDRARRTLTEARGDARQARRRLSTVERELRRAREELDDAEARVAEAERRLEALRTRG